MTDWHDSDVPENIRTLAPYVPGKPSATLERELGIVGAVKLASNESMVGPSPKAIAAVAQMLGQAHYYPDADQTTLRAKLAQKHGVTPKQILVGAGANELIHLMVRCFCQPGDEVLSQKAGFISYRLAAQVQNVRFVETPLREDFSCDVDALVAAINKKTRVIFLGHPNNPTGRIFSKAELAQIFAAVPKRAIVVMDEAYHEFAAHDPHFVSGHSFWNQTEFPLVVLRTFSKAYGLAGFRVGYGVAHEKLVDFVDRVRQPFNANALAQVAALAAMDDDEHLGKTVELCIAGVKFLSTELSALGYRVVPSWANFVMVHGSQPAGQTAAALEKRGIIVRPLAGWGLPTSIRVTVGTPEQNRRVITAVSEVVL